jgi:hypothetical protein
MIWGGSAAVPIAPVGMLLALSASFLAGGWLLQPGRRVRRGRLVAALLVALPISMTAFTLPHTFANGTIADANQVNANFDALALHADEIGTGLYQLGNTAPVPYAIDHERYVVETTAAGVGVVVPIDHGVMAQLCRDLDGCEVTLGRLDAFPSGAGQFAFRHFHLQLSENSSRWRTETDFEGDDGAGGEQAYAVLDCWLTDGDAGTLGGPDAGPGFGLVNIQGTITERCRLVLED